jgi:hypothetical protein
MRYLDLVTDGQVPSMLVHPDWFEPRHPQELPVDTSDAVALYKPAPEISVNTDEFRTLEEWEAYIPTLCPVEPEDLRFEESTVLAFDIVPGSYVIRVDEPVAFNIGDCVFVALDGGGWWTGFTRTTADIPCFKIEVLQALNITAGAGAQVFVTPVAEGVVLLDVNWDTITADATIDPGDPL